MEQDKVRENIKRLREIHGETGTKLGNIIGCAKSTISGYECGSRTIDYNTLNKIAGHYGKTIDEMIHADLSGLKKMEFQVYRLSRGMNMVKRTLPLFVSENALANKSFKRAYRLTENMLGDLEKGETLRGSLIVEIYQLYGEATEEVKELEVFADVLWSIFFWYFEISNTEELAHLHNRMRVKDVDIMEVVEVTRGARDKNKEKLKEFIAEFDEVITDLIKLLKLDSQWADLADYYLALRYLVSMVNNECSEQMNATIGIQMMISYANLENQYALDYLKMCSEL